MSTTDENAPKRFRSPPYPFVPLGKAIERVKQLYPKALHHQVGMTVLAEAWGYAVKSSGLLQTAAALIQFGLLSDEGSGEKRKFQLTQDAIRLAQDLDPNSEKRAAALLRAALAPKVHKELWSKFGSSSVSDMVLRNYLMFDRAEGEEAPFSHVAADALISEYKSTISIVSSLPHASSPASRCVDEGEIEISEVEKPKAEEQDAGHRRPIRQRSATRIGMKEDVFSLKEGDVVFQWPETLSAESFEDLEAWAEIILRKIKRSISNPPADNSQAD